MKVRFEPTFYVHDEKGLTFTVVSASSFYHLKDLAEVEIEELKNEIRTLIKSNEIISKSNSMGMIVLE